MARGDVIHIASISTLIFIGLPGLPAEEKLEEFEHRAGQNGPNA